MTERLDDPSHADKESPSQVLARIDDAVRAADVREVRTLMQLYLAVTRTPRSAGTRTIEYTGAAEAMARLRHASFTTKAGFPAVPLLMVEAEMQRLTPRSASTPLSDDVRHLLWEVSEELCEVMNATQDYDVCDDLKKRIEALLNPADRKVNP